jgi:WD40 repeat protein
MRAHGYLSEQQFLDSDQRSGIKLGEKWEKAIYDNLRDCRALLVLCSPNWADSKWCFAELTAAKMAGKQVIPIVIKECDRSALNEYQAIFVDQAEADQRDAAFERLFQDLEAQGLGPRDLHIWPNPALKDANGRVDHCPFPGLSAFDERYAAVYFGRESEQQTLTQELRRMRANGEPRMLMIVGGSGSGKSSLLLAGVLPALRHSSSRNEWLVLSVARFRHRTPENALFEALADDIVAGYPDGAAAREVRVNRRKALLDLLVQDDEVKAAQAFRDAARELAIARGTHVATALLPVDQFEEFLAKSSGPQATKFLKFLYQLCQNRDDRLLVLSTMRSDYLDVYERHPYALRAPNFRPWRLEPFLRDQLERIIVEPSARAHVEVTLELLGQLKDDTPTVDALPLLAFTLEKLYRKYSDDKKLTLDEYNDLGRMEGSIKNTAEQLFEPKSQPPEAVAAVRMAFVKHLAEVNDRGDFVRLAARWNDLDPSAWPILEQFVTQRLLVKTVAEEGILVEVAHEAIFRCWPLLNSWLKTSADILRWRADVRRARQIASANHQRWKGLSRAQLSVARGWRRNRKDELFPEERSWIATALRREFFRHVATTALFLGITVLAGFSWWERTVARARLAEQYLDNGIALCRQGKVAEGMAWMVRADRTLPAGQAPLQRAISANLEAWYSQLYPLQSIIPHPAPILSICYRHDGSLISGCFDHKVRFWNPLTGDELRPPLNLAGPVTLVRLDAEETTLLTISAPRTWDYLQDGGFTNPNMRREAYGQLQLWDLKSLKERDASRAEWQHVESAAFDTSGKRLITGHRDGRARLWRLDDTQWVPDGPPIQFERDPAADAPMLALRGVVCAEFASRSQQILVGTWASKTNLAARAVDRPLDRPRLTAIDPPQGANALAVIPPAPNNESILVALTNGRVHRLLLPDLSPWPLVVAHSFFVAALDADPSGNRFATAAYDGTVRIWDLARGKQLIALQHDSQFAECAKFDHTRHYLATATWGHAREPQSSAISIWKTPASASRALECGTSYGEIGLVGLNADATRCFTLHRTTDPQKEDLVHLQVWDARTGAKLGQALTEMNGLTSATFVGSSDRLAVGRSDGRLSIWNGSTWIASEDGHRDSRGAPTAITTLEAGNDGQMYFSGDDLGRVIVWNEAGKRIGAPIAHGPRVTGIRYFGARRCVLTAGGESAESGGTVRLWSLSDGYPELGRPLLLAGSVEDMAIDRSHSVLITSAISKESTKRIVQRWDVATHRPIGSPRLIIGSVRLCPDATTILACGGRDGNVLQDILTLKTIGPELDLEGPFRTTCFSGDGRFVLTLIAPTRVAITPVPVGRRMSETQIIAETRIGIDEAGLPRIAPRDEWLAAKVRERD